MNVLARRLIIAGGRSAVADCRDVRPLTRDRLGRPDRAQLSGRMVGSCRQYLSTTRVIDSVEL